MDLTGVSLLLVIPFVPK